MTRTRELDIAKILRDFLFLAEKSFVKGMGERIVVQK
jgi:hypothetical protein